MHRCISAEVHRLNDRIRRAGAVPDWVQDAVWWQVFPLGFVGAEPRAVPGEPVRHRLPQLCAWLDYAVGSAPRGWPSGRRRRDGPHGDYAGYVRSSGLDAVTQYELWKAVWSSLNDANFFELGCAWSGTSASERRSRR